ncbi:tetratricopeptide repeat protein [Arcicella aurantiaca]|uniref:Tetratricopeptide repeat protein n=1 Tax=Arcicella aurantiaca TaxID=591202 RepID=A0A316EEI9_9BACT|nr:tetratricopeptide repeat protein [Arcicella aurantiaca]PWK28490.1 tetratricopeptide repeat protein [Arcicella aurantiaca]
MKQFLLFFIVFTTHFSWGQEEFRIRVCENYKDGKGLKDVSIRIDGIGSVSSDNDGFVVFPNLRKSHNKVTGDVIKITTIINGYSVVNSLETTSYTLKKDRTAFLEIILSKDKVRDLFASKYYQRQASFTIDAKQSGQIENITNVVNDYLKKIQTLNDSHKKEKDALIFKIDSLNDIITKIHIQRENQLETAQKIASLLSSIPPNVDDDVLKNAYSLFIKGEFEQSLKVLSNENLEKDRLEYLQEEKLAELLKRDAFKKKSIYIQKCLFKADLSELIYDFKGTEFWYKKAYEADSNNIDVLINFGNFWNNQNEFEKSKPLYIRGLAVNPDSSFKATLLHNLGNYYIHADDKDSALICFEASLAIRKCFAFYNPEYLPSVANTLSSIGIVYLNEEEDEKAQKYFQEAFALYESLLIVDRKNRYRYLLDVARSSNHLGSIMIGRGNKVAREKLQYALEICDYLEKEKPSTFNTDIKALVLNNLGSLYANLEKCDSSIIYLEKSLKIKTELAKKNPSGYEKDLIEIYLNLGICNEKIKQNNKAEINYNQALNISRKLFLSNPIPYAKKHHILLDNLSQFYLNIQNKEQLHNVFEQSLNDFDFLEKKDSIKYLEIKTQFIHLYQVFCFRDSTEYSKLIDLLIMMVNTYEKIALTNPNSTTQNDYWQRSYEIIKTFPEIIKDDSTATRRVLLQKEIVHFFKIKPFKEPKILSLNLNNLSWYQLLAKDFKSAEQSARESSFANNQDTSINSNLAFALLFQGKFEESKAIFSKIDIQTEKRLILRDLLIFERKGITHKEVSKIRKMLEK